MIITKSPFRISFFGGGTDFPEWFTRNQGLVLSATIDKYCYVILRKLPPFFSFKYRMRYFKTETVNKLSEIKHPSIKAILEKYHKKNYGLEIIHSADVPALSGLGASSAFTAALIKGVLKLNDKNIGKSNLARACIDVERNILKESCGFQDQYACSYGGFNEIHFSKRNIEIKKINLQKRKIDLQNHCTIFFTGISRIGNKLEKEKIQNLSINDNYFKEICSITKEAKKILFSSKSTINFMDEFSNLMRESWEAKKKLAKNVSNKKIDEIYDFGINNGASAGKILGAGGGGFILFVSKNINQKKKLITKLNKLQYVNFCFENLGTHIIYKKINADK